LGKKVLAPGKIDPQLSVQINLDAMKVRGIVLLLCTLACVFANTETIRFTFDTPIRSLETDLGTLYDHPDKPNSIQKLVSPHSQQWFSIEGVLGRSYEVRVCWPASQPTKFDLVYDPETQSVGISSSADYYSNIPDLMEHPRPVQYDVVLNRLLFGVIPTDIADTIGLVLVGCIAGYFLARIPYKTSLF
jgi:hypothetical protein